MINWTLAVIVSCLKYKESYLSKVFSNMLAYIYIYIPIGYPYKINKFEVKGYFEFFIFFLIRKSIQGHFHFHTMSLGIQKYLTAVSLKVSMSLFFCAARVSNSGLICRRWIFLVFFSFSLLLQKLQLDPPSCWYFNFNSYFFDL